MHAFTDSMTCLTMLLMSLCLCGQTLVSAMDYHVMSQPDADTDKDYFETSNDVDLQSAFLSEALSKSSLVQENSDVFIQLGKFLTGNFSAAPVGDTNEQYSPERNKDPKPISDEQNHHQMASDIAIDSQQTHGDVIVMPGYAAWPLLQTAPSNTTVSQQTKPYGYLKQRGVDFELDPKALSKIRLYMTKLAMKQQPSHRHSGKLNLYSTRSR